MSQIFEESRDFWERPSLKCNGLNKRFKGEGGLRFLSQNQKFTIWGLGRGHESVNLTYSGVML